MGWNVGTVEAIVVSEMSSQNHTATFTNLISNLFGKSFNFFILNDGIIDKNQIIDGILRVHWDVLAGIQANFN